MTSIDRRHFLKHGAFAASAAVLPCTLVEMASARTDESFTFAYLSDAHIEHVEGSRFVRSRDAGLLHAIDEINRMTPKPDFVMFGGDLAQFGKRAELDRGADLLSRLGPGFRCVMGEHDYYLDLGAHWLGLFGPQYYSFDHKGVHFVVLNSVLTLDDWTFNRWSAPDERMAAMAAGEGAGSSPFLVGEPQRRWLADDLAKVSRATPIVVFSHSPLQKIHKEWNFWTDDAEEVQALLAPFDRVSVLYGHVHQIQHNRIGNITFDSMAATAWPWPYPQGHYAAGNSLLPKLTIEMPGDGAFREQDVTGWQVIDVHSGRISARHRFHSGANLASGIARGREARVLT